jgi:hypothetical protein
MQRDGGKRSVQEKTGASTKRQWTSAMSSNGTVFIRPPGLRTPGVRVESAQIDRGVQTLFDIKSGLSRRSGFLSKYAKMLLIACS